jgi:glycosyltransferase involved in cell wall biosynthesis
MQRNHDRLSQNLIPTRKVLAMRILYDHQLFSLQSAGGASRYFYELIRELAVISEAHIDVWLGINDSAYPFRDLASGEIRVLGCRNNMRPGRSRYIVNEALGNLLAMFAGDFDVYHPTLYRSMPGVRAHALVATHHDCAHERFPQLFANAAQIVRSKRQLYRRADAIICVSESSRQDLLRFYDIESARTRVIHHGLRPLQGSEPAAAELRKQVPGKFVLFVGSRAAYKNFAALLRAFRATGLDQCMWLVVAGGGALTVDEREIARKLGVQRRLVVIPRIGDAQLAEAYRAATLFVYPSLCEGFGFPPLEAMAAGCPALISNTSSLPEVCRDAPFYFDPEDQGSLEQALLTAIHDEAARQQTRERGLQVAALYSWEKCARGTLALYRECQ